MNKALYIKARLLQAEIEMNGMIAENKQREIEGNSMAYAEQDFLCLILDYGIDKICKEFEREATDGN